MDSNKELELFESLGHLKAELKDLRSEQREIRLLLRLLEAKTHRWAGGLFVMLGCGAFAGWVLSHVGKLGQFLSTLFNSP